MNQSLPSAVLFALAMWTGCADAPPSELAPAADTPPHRDYVEDPTREISEQPGRFAGGEKNTYDHADGLGADGNRDPFDVLAQRQQEGPPEIRTRLHSCHKLQNAAVRALLESFGVDFDATGDPPTAGQLYKSGGGALGASNYDARVGEAHVWTTAGAAKLFDIFVQAAPEIIAAISSVDQCKVDGAGPELFAADGTCVRDAVTCLIGKPASDAHVEICNVVVQAASDLEIGKRIAVATLLAAAHSCE